jgi:hypothetical protein
MSARTKFGPQGERDESVFGDVSSVEFPSNYRQEIARWFTAGKKRHFGKTI